MRARIVLSERRGRAPVALAVDTSSKFLTSTASQDAFIRAIRRRIEDRTESDRASSPGAACGAGFASYDECIAAHAGCDDIAVACGARAGDTCSDDEYCAYAPGQDCGAGDAEAVCVPRPEGCDDIYQPVCGCDDETYGNACEAAGAGIGVLAFGECE